VNYPTHIVIHTLAFEGDADIDRVREWHLDRGWNDVGYHYLVRRSGEVQRGRDEDAVGAHAVNFNRHSIGIALEGHGDSECPRLEQLLAVFRLCDEVMLRYGISIDKVLGHRETGARKTCPGSLVDMDAFRALLFGFVNEE